LARAPRIECLRHSQYGGSMSTTHEQRITDLESDVHRIEHRLDRFAGAAEHLTNAVGDLSQGQRALSLDVREIHQAVTNLRGDVAEVKATQREHGNLLRAILDQLAGNQNGAGTEGI